MTSIVGVLNRQGAAFAADSAVTHAKVHKITNHANKLFSLSKYQPVGVALYNNSSFMGVPWETIIKCFRQYLGELSFKTLAEYINAFWDFLKFDVINRWPDLQVSNLVSFAQSYYKQIYDETLKETGDAIDINDTKKFFSVCISKMQVYNNVYSAKPVCEDLGSLTLTDIDSYIGDKIDILLEPLLKMENCPSNLKEKYLSSMLSILKACENTYTSYTGLVFWGFGEDEYFPSYYEYNISIAFDDRLKYFFVKGADTEKGAAIASFAQTDMAITLMHGIAPDLRTQCYKYYEETMNEFKDELLCQLKVANAPQKLLDVIGAINFNSKAKKYIDGMENYIKLNHTDKLLESISYLSKEDLAEIAENMVSMTYLNRRFTSQEESVGGPVDVAVITKGDGFVWIKRKHYFDASINHQYFERYNR